MKKSHALHADPAFDIAMYDTDGSDLSVEAMELQHAELEEERARVLGLLPVAQQVSNPEVIDETQINYENFVRLLNSSDNAFDIKRIFENSIELDRKSGLITEGQYQALVSLRRSRETYFKYMNSETHVDDGRYGD